MSVFIVKTMYRFGMKIVAKNQLRETNKINYDFKGTILNAFSNSELPSFPRK